METLRRIASGYCHLAQQGADEAGFPPLMTRWYRYKFLFWYWVSHALHGDARRIWRQMLAEDYADAIESGRPPRGTLRLLLA